MVGSADFNLDVFDSQSCFHLLCSTPEQRIILKHQELITSPRVGLTLKRNDDEKEKYWLADYRYLTYPALQTKMKDGVVLSLLAKGKKSFAAIADIT